MTAWGRDYCGMEWENGKKERKRRQLILYFLILKSYLST